MSIFLRANADRPEARRAVTDELLLDERRGMGAAKGIECFGFSIRILRRDREEFIFHGLNTPGNLLLNSISSRNRF